MPDFPQINIDPMAFGLSRFLSGQEMGKVAEQKGEIAGSEEAEKKLMSMIQMFGQDAVNQPEWSPLFKKRYGQDWPTTTEVVKPAVTTTTPPEGGPRGTYPSSELAKPGALAPAALPTTAIEPAVMTEKPVMPQGPLFQKDVRTEMMNDVLRAAQAKQPWGGLSAEETQNLAMVIMGGGPLFRNQPQIRGAQSAASVLNARLRGREQEILRLQSEDAAVDANPMIMGDAKAKAHSDLRRQLDVLHAEQDWETQNSIQLENFITGGGLGDAPTVQAPPNYSELRQTAYNAEQLFRKAATLTDPTQRASLLHQIYDGIIRGLVSVKNVADKHRFLNWAIPNDAASAMGLDVLQVRNSILAGRNPVALPVPGVPTAPGVPKPSGGDQPWWQRIIAPLTEQPNVGQ